MVNWISYTWDDIKAIMDERGLGGTMPADRDATYVAAYELAEGLARSMVPGFHSTKMGRGSRCWEAIEALKGAGF